MGRRVGVTDPDAVVRGRVFGIPSALADAPWWVHAEALAGLVVACAIMVGVIWLIPFGRRRRRRP